MKSTFAILAPLMIALVAVPQPAAATADTCWYDLAGNPRPTPTAVPGPWPHGFGTGSCSSGSTPSSFLSSSANCPPPPFVGAFDGQYCGDVFPGGVQVYCTARVDPAFAHYLQGIVAGFDQDFDGDIDLADGPVGFSSVPPGSPFPPPPLPPVMTFGKEPTVAPYDVGGRVIAYPIVDPAAPLVFSVHVGCSP